MFFCHDCSGSIGVCGSKNPKFPFCHPRPRLSLVDQDIIGGLSVVTMGQFLRLWNRIQVIVVEPNTIDRFEWIWTVDKCFSACSASGSLRGAPIDLCVGPSRNARPPQVQILRVEGGMESLVGRVIGGSVVAWPTRYLFFVLA